MSNYIKKELAARRKDLRAELKHLEDQKKGGVRPKDRYIMLIFLFPMIMMAINMALDYFSQGKIAFAILIILVAIGITIMLLSNKSYKRRDARIAEIRKELRELGVDPDKDED